MFKTAWISTFQRAFPPYFWNCNVYEVFHIPTCILVFHSWTSVQGVPCSNLYNRCSRSNMDTTTVVLTGLKLAAIRLTPNPLHHGCSTNWSHCYIAGLGRYPSSSPTDSPCGTGPFKRMCSGASMSPTSLDVDRLILYSDIYFFQTDMFRDWQYDRLAIYLYIY